MKKQIKSFEDRTLLKLRRTYSKDDTVKGLERIISEKDVLIGSLNSEIEHLEHRLKDLEKGVYKEIHEERVAQKKDLKKNKIIKDLKNQLKDSKTMNDRLHSKIYKLENEKNN